jgi:hypothetical protein
MTAVSKCFLVAEEPRVARLYGRCKEYDGVEANDNEARLQPSHVTLILSLFWERVP